MTPSAVALGGLVLLAAVAGPVRAQSPDQLTEQSEEQPSESPKPVDAIEDGSTVELEYTLTDDAGTVLDSNKNRSPLTYTHGEQQIIPGLEQALAGLRAGEEKSVSVAARDAYGEVNPEAVAEVPKEMIPPHALTVGTKLMARGPGGESRIVSVKEVKESTVIIDLNHPLAGKTLHFAVRVLKVEPPSK